MIFCFSGTGNSRYAADRIALLTGDTVTDMNGLIRQGDMNGSIGDSHIVIVAPTYAWRLPRVVEKWLRTEVIVGRSKAWFVMTCGDYNGPHVKSTSQVTKVNLGRIFSRQGNRQSCTLGCIPYYRLCLVPEPRNPFS